MNTITVNMKDLFTEEKVTREIDISNFSVIDYDAAEGWEGNKIEDDKEKQRKILEEWINRRANNQHETILELSSWSIK